jgi:uncharacterized repeat protein (TIGR03803 family)
MYKLKLAQPLLLLVAALACGASAFTSCLAAQRETVVWNFCTKDKCDPAHGVTPGPLLMDSSGNLFGTTVDSGRNNRGSVFELSPNGRKWTYTLLYSFDDNSPVGTAPNGKLIIDKSGNLYGITTGFGLNGAGAVFELVRRPGKSKWSAKVLYSFCSETDCPDGLAANGSLAYQGQVLGEPYDGKSVLYGTTFYGPENGCTFHGCGLVYGLAPHGKVWQQQVLYAFCQQTNCTDGGNPSGGLLMDGSGNLFGLTENGGACKGQCGIAFELSSTNGIWSETVLYDFCSLAKCEDGQYPVGTLVQDPSGAFYGVTENGGTGGNYGTIFSLVPDQGRVSWTHNILYSFCAQSGCTDGKWPESGMAMDQHGNLFGTAAYEGSGTYNGTAFELSPAGYSVLYSFCAKTNCADGQGPDTAVVLDSSGNAFGTTQSGGSKGFGTLFEVKP